MSCTVFPSRRQSEQFRPLLHWASQNWHIQFPLSNGLHLDLMAAAGAEVPAVFHRPVRLEGRDIPASPAVPCVVLLVYAGIDHFLVHGLFFPSCCPAGLIVVSVWISASRISVQSTPHALAAFLIAEKLLLCRTRTAPYFGCVTITGAPAVLPKCSAAASKAFCVSAVLLVQTLVPIFYPSFSAAAEQFAFALQKLQFVILSASSFLRNCGTLIR